MGWVLFCRDVALTRGSGARGGVGVGGIPLRARFQWRLGYVRYMDFRCMPVEVPSPKIRTCDSSPGSYVDFIHPLWRMDDKMLGTRYQLAVQDMSVDSTHPT